MFGIDFDKLKREWKTFALAVGATIVGAVQAGAELGLQVPDLFNWLPDKVKPWVLLAFGLGMLVFRRYRDADAPKPAQAETPTVETDKT
jgi:hypothetical protein